MPVDSLLGILNLLSWLPHVPLKRLSNIMTIWKLLTLLRRLIAEPLSLPSCRMSPNFRLTTVLRQERGQTRRVGHPPARSTARPKHQRGGQQKMSWWEERANWTWMG